MHDSDTPPITRILAYPPRAEAMAEAAAALAKGELVGLATETVFGVVADASQSAAVQALYAAKGRDQAVPLQILVPDQAIAELIGHFSDIGRRLAERFWPGPLTLVMPLRRDALGLLAPEVLGGQAMDESEILAAVDEGQAPRIGIRLPAHPVPQALLRAYGAPLAASSANKSGQAAALTARATDDALGGALACILDGPCDPGGKASTVVDVTYSPLRILREGAISAEQLAAAVR